MILKNFDLDFPLETFESRSRLNFGNRSVMALYQRCFPRIKVDDAWKVLIECVPEITRSRLLRAGGVFTLQRQFDFEKYHSADIAMRKCIALETMHQGALAVAELCAWPTEPFETAYRGVIERNYINEWTWPKSPKSSPDRRHKAYVQCLHEHDGFYAWIVIVDRKGNELANEFAFKEKPGEFCFMPMLEKLEWSSSQRVVLFDFKGNEVKAVSIPI